MASSRALRDVLRKENGMRKKGTHSKDEVDINDNRSRQRYATGGEVNSGAEAGPKRPDSGLGYRGK